MKILVTGSSGFIGSHLVPFLEENGCGVARADLPECDLRSFEAAEALIQETCPDIIVHLAGRANPGRDTAGFGDHFSSTVLPAINIARAVGRGTALTLFFGSIEEYGDNPVPFREDMRVNAISAYGWAKISACHAVRFLGAQREVPLAWLRPALLFGPGMSGERFIGHVISSCLEDKEARLTPCGQTRDLLYIRDLCGMVLRIAREPGPAAGRILNLCSGIPVKLDEAARTIREITGRGKLAFGSLPYRKNEVMDFYGSPALFDGLYGKTVFTPMRDALRETIAGWK